MAITTIDGVLAGMKPLEDWLKVGPTLEAAGVWHSLYLATGRPSAAAAPSAGLNGVTLSAPFSGAFPYTNPVSANSYLSRLFATGNQPGQVMLYDRLWHNSGIAVATTTNQAITSGAMPARDQNGATNGDGLIAALEVYTATTNAGAITNTTLSYTNQAGTAGRTATMASFPATAVAGTLVQFQLQAGDTGIRSIQGITLGTSYVTGSIGLVVYRPISVVTITAAGIGDNVDALTSGFPRIYDGSALFLAFLGTSTTAPTVYGQFGYTQG
jgi:hypothetical protein